MTSNKPQIDAVRAALSPARMATYEVAANVQDDEDISALVLYVWNTEVSGSLLAPLHICEVVIRNAVSEALERLYGPRWPWSATFERSLPSPNIGYSPRRDLQTARRSSQTTGKVIPELKFVFWQKMFTGRHDSRIWDTHLNTIFPHATGFTSVARLRSQIYNDLEQIRLLRNRIAHHEPIFQRNLADDYSKIVRLIEYRCVLTSAWLGSNQRAINVIANKP